VRRLSSRPTVAVLIATMFGAVLAVALPALPVLGDSSPPVGRCSTPVGGMSAPVGNASGPVGALSRPGHGFGDRNHCHTGPPGR
jgi:hypothetical protein